VHPDGIDVAFKQAAEVAAWLDRHDVPVFSPVVLTHPIAIYGGLDPLDIEHWLAFDAVYMRLAYGILVAKMPRYEESPGIKRELACFSEQGKPIVYLPWPLGRLEDCDAGCCGS
jgi:hypothetical protein